jgi:uncharacterized protein GlcG (DUF336 family)
MTVTLNEAQAVLAASRAAAIELGLAVTIAVVDERGDLIAAERMDGARYPSPPIAQGKAAAAAGLRRPSSALVELANSSTGAMLQRLYENRLVFVAGGVPLVPGGAVGVSGASGDEDEQIALAGAAAVSH